MVAGADAQSRREWAERGPDRDQAPRLLLLAPPRDVRELQASLSAIGYESVVAESGAHALELAHDGLFDIALIGLDVETEVEAVSAGVNLQNAAALRVVYLVDGSDDVSLRRAKRTLPSGYLFKPFTTLALSATLELALSGDAPRPGSAKRLKAGMVKGRSPSGTRAERFDQSYTEERLHVLLDNTADVLSVFDRSGLTLYDSPSFERTLGYDASYRLGASGFKLIHPDDQDVARRAFDRALSAGPVIVEYRIMHHDGSWRVWESVWRNMLDHWAIGGIVSCSRDITEQRAMKHQLAHADRLASLGVLAAAVGHEINNPLTYILANLENLATRLPQLVHLAEKSSLLPGSPALAESWTFTQSEMKLLSEMADQAKQAQVGAQRIAEITRDLRTFVRRDTEAECSLALETVLEDAATLAANQLRHRAKVVKEYGRVPHIVASPNRLVQVFLNLLTNACQALPEHDETNEIVLRTWVDGDYACAEVRDTGCGILPEHLGRLFDPFFTTKPVGVGTGLGLSISRNIVESYGGRIEVQSEVHKGSRFIVRLPHKSTPRVSQSARPRYGSSSPVSRVIRVLVVDDDPLLGSLMKRMLAEGHEVVVAQSVGEAKQQLRDGSFDTIVCDVMMPDAPGTTLHEYLLDCSPSLAHRMVFVTGGIFAEGVARFFERVPNLRLEKPFDSKQLRQSILESLRR